MKISRDNYEPFFLDYLEGKLEEDLIDQFLDFLEKNPDLKEELQLFENVNLPQDQVVFEGKQKLYKTQADEKPMTDNRMIAYLEGDLDEDGRQMFEAYLADHPEIGKEYNLFTQTKLVPEYAVKFPAKQKLYKKSAPVIFMNWAGRAAAVLVLVWGIGYLIQTNWNQNSRNPGSEFAQLKAKTESSVAPPETRTNIRKIETTAPESSPKSTRPAIHADFQKQVKENLAETPSETIVPTTREDIALAQISPILAQLEQESASVQLAVSRGIKPEQKIDSQGLNEIEQYLADRVKKVGNEGMNSAQRILRTGLNVASELSGKRIGYQVKDGKISSVDFDSKLLAFSIPFKKN